MKIKQEILDKIDNPQSRMRIAQKLGVGEPAIAVHMRKNSTNGSLTKMIALQAIAEETGSKPGDILETESTTEKIV